MSVIRLGSSQNIARQGEGDYHFHEIMSKKTYKLHDIAQLVKAELKGDGNVVIESVASLDTAGPGNITFAVDKKRFGRLEECNASAVIVGELCDQLDIPQLVVADVNEAVAMLLDDMADPFDMPARGIHSSAVVADDAKVSPSASIGPGVVIGARSCIGDQVVLHANVYVGSDVIIGCDSVLCSGVAVMQNCKIGKRVIIGPNSVIGFEGFGHYTKAGVHNTIRHIGDVIIEDDVELGACTCVDRAKFASTVIGAGSKIDNLVQVGHNVQMGRGCLLCGQVGVAGSVTFGDYVVVGGATVFRDGITVGNQVQCAGSSAIGGDIEDHEIVAGTPAKPAMDAFREFQAITKLPELIKRVKTLEKRLDELGEAENDK